MNKSLKIKLIFILSLFILVTLWAMLKGSVNLSLAQLLLPENRAILYLRISRILLAIVTGIGLSVSGVALQSILKNPLAEPYLLGTSSGAGLGAVVTIIFGLAGIYIPLSAFIGAILSVIIVYNLGRRGNKIPTQSLILAGVIVSMAFSSIIVFLVTIFPDKGVHGAIWWLWGSLEVFDLRLLFAVVFIVLSSSAIIYTLSQDLNAISIGEEEALHLGIEVEKVKKILFFLTSLITASLICISGIIGFVGLIIPHMTRLLVGPNHRILIPASSITAAIFMIICDVVARSAFQPIEIPIGVITAIIGVPVFIILLKWTNSYR